MLTRRSSRSASGGRLSLFVRRTKNFHFAYGGGSSMKKICTSIIVLFISTLAWADRYGVNESMSESDASLQDMVWGALIVGVIYWVWKRFFR